MTAAAYAAAAAVLPEPHFVLTADGTIVSANAAAQALLGRPGPELCGISFPSLTTDDAARVARYLALCARSRDMVPGALSLLRADGTPVPCRCDGAGLGVPAAGVPTLLLVRAEAREAAVSPFVALSDRVDALNREIARRQEAERVLRQQAGLLDQTHDAIFVWELESGRIVYANCAAEELYGWPRADLLGRQTHGLLQTQAPLPLAEVARLVRDAGEWRGEMLQLARDGRQIAVETRMVLLESGVAAPLVLETLRDMTEVRQARAHLEAAQRLEAVGRLAGGVAHEINNALQGALGFSSFALQRLPEGAPARADIEQALRAGQRAAAITRGLLAFSRRQMLQPTALDLGAVVQEFTAMLQQAAGHERTLRIELPARPVIAQADGGQLEQVLLNLVLNARDATVQGGDITVRIAETALSSSRLTTLGRPELAPGTFAELSVSDTGHGMSETSLSRIFEPFYTTKPPGEGTGLGLAVVHGIVHQSGGAIDVRSTPGAGSTFSIYLPVAEDRAHAPGGAPAAGRGGSERILVVDDEPVVRAFVSELLQDAGYLVHTAADGGEAIRTVDTLAGASPFSGTPPLDLVLTDVIMPGTGGRELSEALTRRYPQLPILFTSGHPGEEVTERGLLQDGAAFIQKPFEADQLLLRVRALLDRAPDAAQDHAPSRARA